MKKDSIQSPHDKYFKEVFSHTDSAASFFQHYLPAPLVPLLDWSSLELQPVSFIDEQLAARQSDLLYKVSANKKPLLLYVLFEHQSTPDPLMPLRLLGYMLRIWEQYLKKHKRAARLPPVLPLVLYHGKEDWIAPLTFESLFELPPELEKILRPFMPKFRHKLVDLSRLLPKQLLGAPEIRILLRLFKSVTLGKQELLKTIEETAALMAELLHDERGKTALVTASLVYVYFAKRDIEVEDIHRVFEHLDQPELEEQAMTIAEQLMKKGRKEGMQKGLQKGKAEGIREGEVKGMATLIQSMVAKGASPEQISDLTGLSIQEIQTLSKKFS